MKGECNKIDVGLWKVMKEEMKKAHTKLVQTKRVVLKNNYILKTKLAKVEKSISEKMEEINEQLDLITRIDYNKVEQRFDRVNTRITALSDKIIQT